VLLIISYPCQFIRHLPVSMDRKHEPVARFYSCRQSDEAKSQQHQCATNFWDLTKNAAQLKGTTVQ